MKKIHCMAHLDGFRMLDNVDDADDDTNTK